MGTLSRLLKEVTKLDRNILRPGATEDERAEELNLISVLIPEEYIGNKKVVRRGCFVNNGQHEIHVRIMNGHVKKLSIAEDKDGDVEVLHNDAKVHIKTTEEFRKYVAGLIDSEYAK